MLIASQPTSEGDLFLSVTDAWGTVLCEFSEATSCAFTMVSADESGEGAQSGNGCVTIIARARGDITGVVDVIRWDDSAARITTFSTSFRLQ